MDKNSFNKLGPTKKKIILLLAGGVGLSLAGTPQKYFAVIKSVADEWNKINETSLKRAIKSLYESKLIEAREHENGSMTVILSDSGRKRALTYNMDTMVIKKPLKWDGKWRLVMFDIPNKRKKERDVLRNMLKQLGFIKYQESAFIFPYECKNEIDYVVEFYNLRPHVRLMEISSFDDDLALKYSFGLS
ncbi:MAG: CRISPR-associated endonuclease Cas2 [Candidatus Sungbacteria bacterium]|uniref:CRISPR-associated endoribonuclease Cas2 n=1 Tax=Candidatus Sungiibacteriota bacterium TaxID=2750080 RepID=A0A931YE29_9BACT|nr:CRISPR-associated endonuclease Cas2 [Candidatus Sungbacteria bacterium]